MSTDCLDAEFNPPFVVIILGALTVEQNQTKFYKIILIPSTSGAHLLMFTKCIYSPSSLLN